MSEENLCWIFKTIFLWCPVSKWRTIHFGCPRGTTEVGFCWQRKDNGWLGQIRGLRNYEYWTASWNRPRHGVRTARLLHQSERILPSLFCPLSHRRPLHSNIQRLGPTEYSGHCHSAVDNFWCSRINIELQEFHQKENKSTPESSKGMLEKTTKNLKASLRSDWGKKFNTLWTCVSPPKHDSNISATI